MATNFKIEGRDWGKNVVLFPDGSRKHLTDRELEELQAEAKKAEPKAEAKKAEPKEEQGKPLSELKSMKDLTED